MSIKTNFDVAKLCDLDIRTINKLVEELGINNTKKITPKGRGGYNKNEYELTDEDVTLICLSAPNNKNTVAYKVDFIKQVYQMNGIK